MTRHNRAYLTENYGFFDSTGTYRAFYATFGTPLRGFAEMEARSCLCSSYESISTSSEEGSSELTTSAAGDRISKIHVA